MVSDKKQNMSTFDISLGYIIRRVMARNKEEAIGIFTTKTSYVKALQKLNIECHLEKEISLLK